MATTKQPARVQLKKQIQAQAKKTRLAELRFDQMSRDADRAARLVDIAEERWSDADERLDELKERLQALTQPRLCPTCKQPTRPKGVK